MRCILTAKRGTCGINRGLAIQRGGKATTTRQVGARRGSKDQDPAPNQVIADNNARHPGADRANLQAFRNLQRMDLPPWHRTFPAAGDSRVLTAPRRLQILSVLRTVQPVVGRHSAAGCVFPLLRSVTNG